MVRCPAQSSRTAAFACVLAVVIGAACAAPPGTTRTEPRLETSAAVASAPAIPAASSAPAGGPANPPSPLLVETAAAVTVRSRVPVAFDVALPADVACTLEAATWAGTRGVTALHVDATGPAFASVRDGRAKVSIPIGKARRAALEISDGGLTVRGYVEAKALELRANAPFMIGPFLAVQPQTQLAWVGGKSGAITVAMDVPTELRLKEKAVSVERPCADVNLTPQVFDALKVLFGDRDFPKKWVKGTHVAIGSRADRDPEGTLVSSTGTAQALALETKGGRTRIALPKSSGIVVGWVATTTLTPRHSASSSHRGARVRTVPGERESLSRLYCDEDVPLAAVVGTTSKVVGFIDEGQTIDVVAKDETTSEVVVRSSSITPAKGARFVVRNDVLQRCHAALPKFTR